MSIHLTVNGQSRPLESVAAHATTLDWLRDNGLTGSKEGCAEGECGACAILVAQPDAAGGTTWTAVNSCLVPVAALDGQEIITSEGLGSPESMHPVQDAMARGGGSQCGYCTPGFVCSMAAEFYRRDRGDGTGRRSTTTSTARTVSTCMRSAATSAGAPGTARFATLRIHLPHPSRMTPWPCGVIDRRRSPSPPTSTARTAGSFVRPGSTMPWRCSPRIPRAVVAAGFTDWGVEVNIRGRREPLVVAVDRIPELLTLEFTDEFVEIGASVSLSEAERFLAGRIPLLAQMFPQFASRLIRNRATIGGNLGTGSPIGDTPPALLALDAGVILVSAEGEREVALSDYFTGYRETVRRADELIRAIRIPLPLANLTAFHKIAKRRFDDISSVAVGFGLDVRDGIVRDARIGLGGVAATPLRARETEAILIGRPWSLETARTAAAALGLEGTPMSDHRASAEYRAIMLSQALLKLHAESADREVVGG